MVYRARPPAVWRARGAVMPQFLLVPAVDQSPGLQETQPGGRLKQGPQRSGNRPPKSHQCTEVMKLERDARARGWAEGRFLGSFRLGCIARYSMLGSGSRCACFRA